MTETPVEGTTPEAPATPATEQERSFEDSVRAQQERAGKSPDEAPQPLAGSGNEGKRPATTIGGEEYELPHDTDVALKSLAGRTVSTDSQGVDRVVSQHVPDWRPAPIEPDPDEVARLEAATEALEAHREERRELLGLRADQSREAA